MGICLEGVRGIRENIERFQISCDYVVQDSLFIANTKSGFKHVEEEHSARNQLGYKSRLHEKKSLSHVIGSEDYKGAVQYPETFGMNSYLYCQALKQKLNQLGVRIFEKTPANSIEGNIVTTPQGRITAKHIVVCADRFIPDLGKLKKEIYHVQTFLGITKPLKQDQVHTIFPGDPVMVWDTDLVYNYFRLTGDNRLLIGGGDILYTYAHNVSNNTTRFRKRLSNYIQRKFPYLEFEMEFLWPGMLGVSKDLLPIMGSDPENKHIFYIGAATGLPWATALGAYAADKITNDRDEFDTDFSPERHFAINSQLQSILTTPITYALSHGIAKYF